jgi:hypothetical protein
MSHDYDEIAASVFIKVVYICTMYGNVWHVKTGHVPHIGNRIQLLSSGHTNTYTVDNIVWNPQLANMAVVLDEDTINAIDMSADCLIFLSP